MLQQSSTECSDQYPRAFAKNFALMAAFVIIFILPGCISWSKVDLTERDHPSGFAKQIRATAIESFEYAQMSYNVYDKADGFDLPDDLKPLEAQYRSDIDFQYKVWSRDAGDGPSEIVLVFRGTDSLIGDLSGNAFLQQQHAGLDLFDRFRSRYPNASFIVAGHSLGGAIASHITLNRPDVSGYFFDSSPRFLKGRRNFENRRNSIVEYGEILKLLRLFGREPTQLYTSVNCINGSPVAQHSQRKLAECLTWMAAWTNERAKQSMINNRITNPETRANGPKVPGT